MGEKTMVDDSYSGGAFTIRPFDILYPIIRGSAVYLHIVLESVDVQG